MALLEVNWTPGRRELRQFAGLWIVFFGLFACYFQWYERSPAAAVTLAIVAFAGLAGLLRPGVMRPVYIVWTALALPVGWTISHLLLVAVYYLIMTPMGLAMRVCGYDPLKRTFDYSAATYWTPHDPAREPSRYFKQY